MTLTWSLHTGGLPRFEPAALAELVLASGCTTAPVLVGEGLHASVENIYPELPDYVNALSEAGVECHSCDLDVTLEQLVGEPDFIKLLAACGIKQFSILALRKKGYFVRSRLTKAREQLDLLSKQLEKHEVKLILPVVGESLIPSPSAAFHLVRGLPPYAFGIRLDPGGELFEGFEAWDYTVALLMDYLVSVTVRDSILIREPSASDANGKGWARRWATVQDGMTDWTEMVRQLRNVEFSGSLELRPMASTTAEQIKSEVEYLQGLIEPVEPAK